MAGNPTRKASPPGAFEIAIIYCMVRKRLTCLSLSWAVLGILLGNSCASGRETEAQLLQRIQAEQNPVKKAKDEIKLAKLRLAQVQDAYSQGDVEAGAKLLATFVEDMKASWKLLQASGRKAVKQPDGFRDLEISLREDERLLLDMGHRLAYFDREPVDKATQELERMRQEVLQALFPSDKSQPINASRPSRELANPGSPSKVQ